jgi:hypothetical protein
MDWLSGKLLAYPMQKLEPLTYLLQIFPISRWQAEDLARRDFFPEGVIVRLGRRVLVNPEKLSEFIAGGGKALPGGWRRRPK